MTHTLQRAVYRAYQGVMKIGNYFVDYRTPEVLQGPGVLQELPGVIQKTLQRILLVTDAQLYEIGLLDPLLLGLKSQGIEVVLFKDLDPNPSSNDVAAGLERYRQGHCQGIVAFGGGSPMDCAKAIGAQLVRPTKNIQDLQGLFKVRRRLPPLVAIPTTAGTGSETTMAAVITDAESQHKASINDPVLIPDLAVLDPELTFGLAPSQTASTALDAMTHAIEAYTNHSYCTNYEKKLAQDAVQLIYENLPIAYEDGENLRARANLQKAALYAGRAFTRGSVGYVHALGHTLGGLYGTPHALAMATILPHVLRQFGPRVDQRLGELGALCGFRGNKRQQAQALIQWIEETKTSMGLPQGIDVIQDEDIPQMINWALAEANPLYPVPEIWFAEDFERLIERLRNAA